jgi:hypothetical protein
MSHVVRRTVDTLALLDLNLAKVLDTHRSSHGEVSQRMVVLSSAYIPSLFIKLTEIPFFCPSMTRSRAASSLSPCRLSSLPISGRSSGDDNLHRKLVELDQDFMPNSSIFKDGQSIRIHLLHLTRLSVRRESGSMVVFLGVRVAESYSGSGGGSEAGGGVDCARG